MVLGLALVAGGWNATGSRVVQSLQIPSLPPARLASDGFWHPSAAAAALPNSSVLVCGGQVYAPVANPHCRIVRPDTLHASPAIQLPFPLLAHQMTRFQDHLLLLGGMKYLNWTGVSNHFFRLSEPGNVLFCANLEYIGSGKSFQAESG